MRSFFIFFAITLASCCISTVEASTYGYKDNKDTPLEKTDYQPKGKKTFALKILPKKLQKYAYADVCRVKPTLSISNDCLLHKLDYDIYAGMLGYYEDDEKIKPRLYDHIYAKRAVLENGDVVYLLFSEKYSHIGDDVISVDLHQKTKSLVGRPFVEGAKTQVVSYAYENKNGHNFSLNNGSSKVFPLKVLELVEEISKAFPDRQGEIADSLLSLRLNYDEFEERLIISSSEEMKSGVESHVSLVILVDKDRKVTPFYTVKYRGDNWLFVNSYSMSADGVKKDFHNVNFNRDNGARSVWEWETKPMTSEMRNYIHEFSTSEKAMVRFNGDRYYSNLILSDNQKKELSLMVRLLELMSGGN